MASTMNRMLCRAENEMFTLAVGMFKAAGRHIGALCFDGFMVYKSTSAKSPSTTVSIAP
jgi:hypothetical protein